MTKAKYYPIPGNTKLPFSAAVQVGETLYVSGQMGVEMADGAARLVGGGMDAEARKAIENMRDVLERHGSSLDRVVKVTVMLADIRQWPAFNKIYVEYFKDPLPARSAFGASGLALGGAVELECIATTGEGRG
ncbi:MAG: RidA family protein [Gemmatimonadota bacterium]|nr:RidA family protein [Gemmatimonadota bacterium]